ncbi:MAG TPA: electron transfer flavoprotein subunit alpha/FixB family protein [Candidatus Thermoplasmatota archaeon]|nr:electron transfer flavoprotein subunit alpha/FixB family protein [Candidatus Thermoplasmatota archaeon]
MPEIDPKNPAAVAEWSGLWVFIEHHANELAPVSRELLAKGRELADQRKVPLTGILLGTNNDSLAKETIAYGADHVIYVDAPIFAQYATEPYVEACAKLVHDRKPEVFLIGATHTGRDFGSRIAVRTHTGCTADATKLEWDHAKVEAKNEWELIMLRPAFGGKILAGIVCPKHRPWIASARPNTFVPMERNDARKGTIEKITDMPLSGKYHSRVIKFEKLAEKGAHIDKAEFIVSGGMGLGKKENLKLIEDCARELGAAVGASRKIVDAGWISRTHQVGQTGTTVRPKLYLAAGISGAVQHLAGMQESGTVVAVNSDKKAPIFGFADIGVVGDATKILPALTAELQRRKQKK